MTRILVVDDQIDVRHALQRFLGQWHQVSAAENGEEAVDLFLQETPDCVLLDHEMPGLTGLEVLGRLTALDASVPVIMLTGVVDIQLAISCLKQGAYDYLTKPPEFEELAQVVARAVEKRQLASQVGRLQGELSRVYGVDRIVGRHPLMRDVYELIGRVAPRRVSVLIEGPSGTGKELVARAIHHHGGAASRPFVALNCAAIPEGLIESELFGHERGAFTDAKTSRAGVFEQADGGTLFLDEIGDATRGGDFPDEETIKALTDAGIRVYFIQILARERYRERPDGTVEVIAPRQSGLFGQMQAQQEAEITNKTIDEARKLARRTGGEHFLATTGDQIKDIYAKIDKLERSDVGGRTVFSHEERYRPYLMAALGMLAVELILCTTWLRKAP